MYLNIFIDFYYCKKLLTRIKNPISGGSKTSNSMQNEISKKRKRVLTFTSEKLEKLNEAFSRNSNPSGK